MSDKPNSGLGIMAGVLGVLGAVGVAVAASNSSSKRPQLRGGLRGARGVGPKKPCGCGR